jgi:hypothetical protein
MQIAPAIFHKTTQQRSSQYIIDFSIFQMFCEVFCLFAEIISLLLTFFRRNNYINNVKSANCLPRKGNQTQKSRREGERVLFFTAAVDYAVLRLSAGRGSGMRSRAAINNLSVLPCGNPPPLTRGGFARSHRPPRCSAAGRGEFAHFWGLCTCKP